MIWLLVAACVLGQASASHYYESYDDAYGPHNVHHLLSSSYDYNDYDGRHSRYGLSRGQSNPIVDLIMGLLEPLRNVDFRDILDAISKISKQNKAHTNVIDVHHGDATHNADKDEQNEIAGALEDESESEPESESTTQAEPGEDVTEASKNTQTSDEKRDQHQAPKKKKKNQLKLLLSLLGRNEKKFDNGKMTKKTAVKTKKRMGKIVSKLVKKVARLENKKGKKSKAMVKRIKSALSRHRKLEQKLDEKING